MSKRIRTLLCALSAFAITVLVWGCGGSTATPARTSASFRNTPNSIDSLGRALPSLQKPALMTNNVSTGALQYWPIGSRGGNHPLTLDKGFGVANGFSMAADGNSVIAADEGSSQLVIENVVTGKKSALSDPNGVPIDVAVGTDHSIYVANYAKPDGNVTVYPQGTGQPAELTCSLIYLPEYVAVDAAGNVYVNGYEPNNAMGVVEILQGGGQCFRLHLRPEYGYVAGIGYDPKSGDLIVMDNPGLCAGGEEGHIVIYPKPYQGKTGRSVILGGNCTGSLRLNASSTIIFYGDTSVDESYSFIKQRSFPDGKRIGNVYTGGAPGGFTTIPNRLPN